MIMMCNRILLMDLMMMPVAELKSVVPLLLMHRDGFNIKMSSFQHGNSHYIVKKISQLSYFIMGMAILGKTVLTSKQDPRYITVVPLIWWPHILFLFSGPAADTSQGEMCSQNGDSLTLSCAVTTNMPAVVQWHRVLPTPNGSSLMPFGSPSNRSVLLVIPMVMASDFGLYFCKATYHDLEVNISQVEICIGERRTFY